MPIKILQRNERVAEVQFTCDLCGKLVGNHLIPNSELEAQQSLTVFCWRCRQASAEKS